jgi:hypothetical protein
MIRYQVFYRKIDGAEVKSAVINAATEPSARNRFNQMYHDCIIINVEEIQDEN